MSSKKYTVGVDCRLAGLRHAGIGRYTQNLIQRLPQLDSKIEWVFFFHDKNQVREVLKETPTVKSKVRIVLAPIKHYSIKEQLLLPGIFSQERLDLLHVPHFNVPLLYSGKIVVTIHDLLWHQQRGLGVTTLKPWVYWLKYFSYRYVTRQAVSKAKAVLVPANTIKKTLDYYYPSIKNKVVVTPEGIGQVFLTKQFPNKSSKITRQLVYTGSLYPHKNLQLVLQALIGLPDYQLLVVGSRNVFLEKMKQQATNLGVSHQVKFAGFLSDEELVADYQSSLALVQPSLSEGFGLTGLEAMAVGLPVLASDIPIFREIYQNAATYFDPHSPASFIKALAKLEKSDRSQIIKNGRQVASQYSWDKLAQQTLEIYQQALFSN